jgi:3-isopropylmalate dehydrogenase
MKTRVVGIIKGEGVGAEIIDSALRCLRLVEQSQTEKLDYVFYEGSVAGENAFAELESFYQEIRNKHGVILRSSIAAPFCYRLRRDFDLFYKLIFFKPIPALADVSLLKQSLLTGLDLLLIRHNNAGLYHGVNRKSDDAGKIICEQTYDISELRKLAKVAFSHAEKRKKRVCLLIKSEILGELGAVWIDAFEHEAAMHPSVAFDVLPPDSGSAQIFLTPNAFDVVVAPDLEADMLSDQLAVLIHGTRAVTPSANSRDNSFATYQTIHGTAKGLANKDIANPAGMILAAAMMLELSFEMTFEAERLRCAVGKALENALQTGVGGRNSDLILRNIGTARFTELVLDALTAYETSQLAA